MNSKDYESTEFYSYKFKNSYQKKQQIEQIKYEQK